MNTQLKILQKKIISQKLDGFISFKSSNIFYLTGFSTENAFVFISRKDITLAIPELLYSSASESVKSPPWRIEIAKSYKDFFKQYKFKKIGFEDTVSYQCFRKLKKIPGIKLKSCNNLVENMRLVKNKDELSKIKIACEISKKTVKFARNKIKAGMTEKELADKLEYFLRTNGAEKSAFDIIVASGKNSCNPHHKPTNRKFQKEDVVLVDLGCVYKGYSSDLTRTFFLGRINNYTKKVSDIVKDAQQKAISVVKDGVACKEVDFIARNSISKNGFRKYFIHSTGHGTGIDIHEEPYLSAKSRTILKKGMVVTVEPGIYIPNRLGIRIEDTVLITKTGCEVLT